MATNERFMPVSPRAVWETLAAPGSYSYWIVGTKEVRDADATWPAPGSKFHHTVGVGPLKLRDHTESLEAEPPRLLRLRTKGRPVGTARVTLEMTARDGGTVVRMTEKPDGLSAVLALNPLLHALTRMRNAESLMRLEELAQRRSA